MRIAPASLNGRLVAAAVSLVAIVGLLVTGATTLAMHKYLTDQVDNNVQNVARRSTEGPGRTLQLPGNGGGSFRGPGVSPGTLNAAFTSTQESGSVAKQSNQQLTAAQLKVIGAVPINDDVHGLDIPGLGGYRVTAQNVDTNLGTITIVTGLPTGPIDDTLDSLLLWQLLLTLCGVGVAWLAGDLLVRRTLRPLRQVAQTAHEVTELPLDTGSVGETVRVPEGLTDPRTEVGQVGASLNRLLGHVESALDARHRSEQQVRQFLADASHELRTPLSTISGYAELSRRTPGDSATLSMAMGKVETEAHRMSSLVEDMLLLARLDAGRPLESDEVDVTRLLLEDVADARMLAPEHHWRLELPDEPVTVVGDEQRLHQVVTNLLGNARRHTPPGTTVTVSAQGGDEPRFVVHDDGPGLPDGLAAHVFERFTRGDSSRTRDSGGAGLGLSLVAAISQAHGGTASVESQPGSTTFTVALTAHPAAVVNAGGTA